MVEDVVFTELSDQESANIVGGDAYRQWYGYALGSFQTYTYNPGVIYYYQSSPVADNSLYSASQYGSSSNDILQQAQILGSYGGY